MNNYSQISQDLFALNYFGNKGFFVDLGCGDGSRHPCGNNTKLLEDHGWNGLSFDISQPCIEAFNKSRKTRGIQVDLTKVNLADLLSKHDCPQRVDYLSFDVDEATDHVLLNFPINEYKFNLITFEHNLYLQKYKGLKDIGKNLFLNNGYELLIENVILENHGAVEDWFIHKDLAADNKNIFMKNSLHRDVIKKYFNI